MPLAVDGGPITDASYRSTALTTFCIQLGNLLNWWLFGALSVQIYLYYLAFQKDRPWSKAAVYATYCLETCHTFALTVDYFQSGKSDTANPIAVVTVPLIGGLVAFIAQCLYAHRIQIITTFRFLPWFIRLLALGQLGSAMVFALGVVPRIHLPPSQFEDFLYDASRIPPIAGYAWIASCIICDITIAIIMVHLLKKKFVRRETREMTIRVVRLVLETGVMTAIVNILTLTLLATARYTGSVYMIPMIILSKVYANSTLVLFNNRMTMPVTRSQIGPSSVEATTIRFNSFRSSRPENAHAPGNEI